MKALFLWIGWMLWSTLSDVKSQPMPEKAVVMLYREREFASLSYTIFVNGKRVSALSTNRFIRLEVPAGKVVIDAKQNYLTKPRSVYFGAEPGKLYYIKAVEDVHIVGRSLLLGFVSEAQARRDLTRIKPMEPETENELP